MVSLDKEQQDLWRKITNCIENKVCSDEIKKKKSTLSLKDKKYRKKCSKRQFKGIFIKFFCYCKYCY